MNLFVLNRGSSTIKSYLYHSEGGASPTLLWEGQVAWKNQFESLLLSVSNSRGARHKEAVKGKDAAAALCQLLGCLVQGETALLDSLDAIDAVGHRVVHAGAYFTGSVRITSEVKEKIRRLADLAPLHNLAELEGIDILEQQLPHKPHFAVFDTAFHHTLPKAAQIYPGPYRWYEEGIRRYGFHGISFQYSSRRAAEWLERDLKTLKMVICHLGSGASLCAVKEGKSVDTTMGFTPLEGLMMDTRSGSVDPGILLHLLEKKKITLAALSQELYQHSGLLGLSQCSSDMRDILEQSATQNGQARLALEVYLHRLNQSIGAMVASLQGIDVLVFTAGIGENASLIRERVCDHFHFLGISLDRTKNQQPHKEDALLSAPESQVQVLLIHTQEALEIARECMRLLKDA